MNGVHNNKNVPIIKAIAFAAFSSRLIPRKRHMQRLLVTTVSPNSGNSSLNFSFSGSFLKRSLLAVVFVFMGSVTLSSSIFPWPFLLTFPSSWQKSFLQSTYKI